MNIRKTQEIEKLHYLIYCTTVESRWKNYHFFWQALNCTTILLYKTAIGYSQMNVA
jgi:hypothetical protein